jgi:hypothetical protein
MAIKYKSKYWPTAVAMLFQIVFFNSRTVCKTKSEQLVGIITYCQINRVTDEG